MELLPWAVHSGGCTLCCRPRCACWACWRDGYLFVVGMIAAPLGFHGALSVFLLSAASACCVSVFLRPLPLHRTPRTLKPQSLPDTGPQMQSTLSHTPAFAARSNAGCTRATRPQRLAVRAQAGTTTVSAQQAGLADLERGPAASAAIRHPAAD